ncbi:MAG: hypothetical protein ACXABG_15915 [Promethearchaeota archaeon]|jgi:GTPase SAR1 family protein
MTKENQMTYVSGFDTNKVKLSEMKDIKVKKIIFIGDGMSGKTQIVLTLSQKIIEYLNNIHSATASRKLRPFDDSALLHAEAVLNQDSKFLSSEFINWAEGHGFLVQYGRVKWNVRSNVSLDTETIGFEDFNFIFPYVWNGQTYRIHLSGSDVGGQNIFDHLRNVIGKVAGRKDTIIVVFDRSRALSCWNSVEQVRNVVGDRLDVSSNIPRIIFVGNKIDLEEHIRSQKWQAGILRSFMDKIKKALSYGRGSYLIPSLVRKHGEEREIQFKLKGSGISFPDLESLIYNSIRDCDKNTGRMMTDVNMKSLAREIAAQLVFERKISETKSNTNLLTEKSMVAIMTELGNLLFQRRPLAIQYSGGIEFMDERKQTDSFSRVRSKWDIFDFDLRLLSSESIESAIVSAGNSRNLLADMGTFYSTDALRGIGVQEILDEVILNKLPELMTEDIKSKADPVIKRKIRRF